MKTILGSLLALGLLSSTASAWYCPPGYGSGYGHSVHRPQYSQSPKVIVTPGPVAPAIPVVPLEPAPAPEPVPQK